MIYLLNSHVVWLSVICFCSTPHGFLKRVHIYCCEIEMISYCVQQYTPIIKWLTLNALGSFASHVICKFSRKLEVSNRFCRSIARFFFFFLFLRD